MGIFTGFMYTSIGRTHYMKAAVLHEVNKPLVIEEVGVLSLIHI